MSSPPYAVYEYEDENGHSEFREWRLELRRSNPQASAKVDWLIDLLEDKGTSLQFPYVSHIGGPIYELRGKTGRNTVRIYYWQQDGELFIVAAGEVKQQNEADRRLIKKALAAHEEYNRRVQPVTRRVTKPVKGVGASDA